MTAPGALGGLSGELLGGAINPRTLRAVSVAVTENGYIVSAMVLVLHRPRLGVVDASEAEEGAAGMDGLGGNASANRLPGGQVVGRMALAWVAKSLAEATRIVRAVLVGEHDVVHAYDPRKAGDAGGAGGGLAPLLPFGS